MVAVVLKQVDIPAKKLKNSLHLTTYIYQRRKKEILEIAVQLRIQNGIIG
jgi:hypothetical protein